MLAYHVIVVLWIVCHKILKFFKYDFTNWKGIKLWFHQGLFFPISPVWTRLSPMNDCFWSARLSSWIASKKWSATVFKHVEKTVADLKPSSRGRPRIWWGSGAYTPSTLRTTLGIEWQRLYENSRGRARQWGLSFKIGCVVRPVNVYFVYQYEFNIHI